MNYSAGKDQKHLLWTIDEDVMPKCNILEFRLCDWGILELCDSGMGNCVFKEIFKYNTV